MKTKYFFLAAAAAMMLTACSNDESDNSAQKSDGIIRLCTTGMDVSTRATGQNIQGKYFDATEQVDIFLWDATNTTYTTEAGETPAFSVYPQPLTTTATVVTNTTTDPVTYSNTLDFATTQFWPMAGHSLNVWAVYPTGTMWDSENNASTAPTVLNNTTPNTSFSVQADQTSEANYKKSDLMVGLPYKTAVANPLEPETAVSGWAKWSYEPIPLKFKHMLSKVNIKLSKTATTTTISWNDLKNAEVSLVAQKTINFNPKSFDALTKLDYSAGEEIVLYDGVTANSYLDGTSGEPVASEPSALDADVYLPYSGIIVPQTINGGTGAAAFLKVKVGEDEFEYTMPTNFNFLSQKVYTLNVKIHKASILLTATIEDWETGDDIADGSAYWKQ